ncbi:MULTISPECIES: polysaccharide deacetylase family protein [unclassified Mucilaginibacter]|uniref:polysaccharide deacetylase family protein n=1 Tax=unclassified Mucilaginibacter TaxID=2617802 RepID=UPI002AC99175|nr:MULTISPECIES: polysaccharide deacetylase family protein [unclassified Mucilaginibacter]MEB0260305.1 polysaccharide deacetylase family protein [Mucilaginibacter sp. 10I4]MEB0277284.1 polysaccharide deacetylase family protein [Mucilaginibacter sp. 10B2]MEB0303197.1 polysaccharide deacetylase family protein [Mucilaginibacter sp. 5C4]WPX25410.1 polysaccharide deacetylase family protein [Mucilaginibacter sp. 5C4]
MSAIKIKFSTFIKFRQFILVLGLLLNCFSNELHSQVPQTYAEKLGWKKGDKVILFHVDDAGMSYDSNRGVICALEKGLATSLSVMMPCPWMPNMIHYLSQHPNLDAGLHLTLTSEWKEYRWGSVSGVNKSPGLSDNEGALWNNVADVLSHASPDEIEAEIMAQLSRARKMGFNPTHLDTHMGTLWASPEYLERYIKVGIKEHIPILFSAGGNTFLRQELGKGPLAGLNTLVKGTGNKNYDTTAVMKAIQDTGKRIWNGGLAVVDDLYLLSYDWKLPAGIEPTDDNLRKFKTEKYKALLQSVKPGITVILIHCTNAGGQFKYISDSGNTRKGDLLAMTDPELKEFIGQRGFILTTWRELQERRDHLGKVDTDR